MWHSRFKNSLTNGIEDNIHRREVLQEAARQAPAQAAVKPKTRRPRLVALVSWAFRYQKALLDACQTNDPDPDDIKSILWRGADIERLTDGATPLQHALKGHYWKTASILLENGADINGGPWVRAPPLHTAVETGDDKMLRFLISHGANIEERSRDLFY